MYVPTNVKMIYTPLFTLFDGDPHWKMHFMQMFQFYEHGAIQQELAIL